MARIVKTITIAAEGRDKGKTFILTEMPPRVGHKWATRALFAMLNSGADIPDNVMSSGMAGIAMMGGRALTLIPAEAAEPLLEQLLDGIRINYEPTKSHMERDINDSDIEEIATLFLLQKEVFLMHTEPFTKGVKSTSVSTPEQAATPS